MEACWTASTPCSSRSWWASTPPWRWATAEPPSPQVDGDRDGATLWTVINVGPLGRGRSATRPPSYPLNAVDDPEVDPWCAARLRRLGKESEVGVPILVEGEPWGELYATTAPGEPRFRGEDVRSLEAVAGQLAVRGAHERRDGSGYPDGLAGEEIPLGARIVFACDTYDAMTTDRPYRAALPVEEAQAELRRAAGTQLDPRVVEALLDVVG